MIYNNSDILLVSSPGFIESIVQKGIKREKLHYFPQWAEDIFKPILKTDKKLISLPENSFIIMFAGNIGEAQDFGSILKAALKVPTDAFWPRNCESCALGARVLESLFRVRGFQDKHEGN